METNEIIYQHVYQNTVDGVLLFYDNTDRIIFFTILSVLSERYGVRIIAVSLMPDHYHLLVEASGRSPIVNFIRTLNSVYAKAFNRTINRKGRLFNWRFGCAPKKTTKEIISTINYILNNPLVKCLDEKVENSRWNYLPYAIKKNPFSADLTLESIGRKFMSAMKYVVSRKEDEQWLTYGGLKKVCSGLNNSELSQLEDYTISLYDNVDYDSAAKYFGSMDKMITAANYNSGSEYGISEVFEVKDDRFYRTMRDYLETRHDMKNVKEVFYLEPKRQVNIAIEMKEVLHVPVRQVEKYMQLRDGTLYLKKDHVVRVRNHYRHLTL